MPGLSGTEDEAVVIQNSSVMLKSKFNSCWKIQKDNQWKFLIMILYYNKIEFISSIEF